MKILGIIPARCGSKGIIDKNIKLLNNKPLIYYTIENALKSKLDKIVVTTDCDKVIDKIRHFNIETIKRPKELARDDSPTILAVNHVLETLSEKYDVVMILQPTSPLRQAFHIDESINIFLNNQKVDCLVSVVKVPHNYMPEKLMYLDDGYLHGNLEIKRRQNMDIAFARNGAIYLSKVEILKNNNILGDFILPYEMDKISSLDIDDIEDYYIIESILKVRNV